MKRRGIIASVSPLFVGLALLMVGNGLLGSLLGVRADLEGFSTITIGIVMAMYYVGFLLGSLTIPRWLISVGHIRVFTGLAALTSAAALSYALITAPALWGLLRFVAGLCMSGLYVTVESWLNERASNEGRGRLLSVYALVSTLGLGLGQLLLGVATPLDPTLFLLVGILISLAVVPVSLIRIPEPTQTVPVELSVSALRRTAPLGFLTVAISGAAGGSFFALGAVYATRVGMDPGRVGFFMASTLVGAVVSQYPLGHLSDRSPRRRVLLLVATGAVVSAVLAATVDPAGPWLFLLAAVYGSLAFPMYSLAVSLINDSLPVHQLVGAAAGIMFVYGIGSITGPLAVSVLMTVFGPDGYFWGLAGLFLPVTAYSLWRIISKARPIQRRFLNLPPRSSIAVALLAESEGDDQI